MTYQYVRRSDQSGQKDNDSSMLQRTAVRSLPAREKAPQVPIGSQAFGELHLGETYRQEERSPLPEFRGLSSELISGVGGGGSDRPVSDRDRPVVQRRLMVGKTYRQEERPAKPEFRGLSSELISEVGAGSDRSTPVQRQEEKPKAENKTGLPDRLKEGIESMSGYDLSGVRVNYNSPKPAQLNAHAYTQGHAIEVAPGQERHLPHEAWHVVQQKQGRVKPTMEVNGYKVNGDRGLEREADVMGQRILQRRRDVGEYGETVSHPVITQRTAEGAKVASNANQKSGNVAAKLGEGEKSAHKKKENAGDTFSRKNEKKRGVKGQGYAEERENLRKTQNPISGGSKPVVQRARGLTEKRKEELIKRLTQRGYAEQDIKENFTKMQWNYEDKQIDSRSDEELEAGLVYDLNTKAKQGQQKTLQEKYMTIEGWKSHGKEDGNQQEGNQNQVLRIYRTMFKTEWDDISSGKEEKLSGHLGDFKEALTYLYKKDSKANEQKEKVLVEFPLLPNKEEELFSPKKITLAEERELAPLRTVLEKKYKDEPFEKSKKGEGKGTGGKIGMKKESHGEAKMSFAIGDSGEVAKNFMSLVDISRMRVIARKKEGKVTYEDNWDRGLIDRA